MWEQKTIYIVLGLPDGSHRIIKDIRDPNRTYPYPVYGVFNSWEEARRFVEDDTPDDSLWWSLQYY
jgi:hypothetical protein